MSYFTTMSAKNIESSGIKFLLSSDTRQTMEHSKETTAAFQKLGSSNLTKYSNWSLVQIKISLKIVSAPPPLPVSWGVLITLKLLGTASPKTDISPAFNQVSAINKNI